MDNPEQTTFPAVTPAKAVSTFFSTISFLWHRFFIFCVGFVLGSGLVLWFGLSGSVHKKQSEKSNNVSVEKTSVWGQAKTSVVIKN